MVKKVSNIIFFSTPVKYLLKMKDGFYLSQLKLGFSTHKYTKIFLEKEFICKEKKGRTCTIFLTAKGEFVRQNLQAIITLLGDDV